MLKMIKEILHFRDTFHILESVFLRTWLKSYVVFAFFNSKKSYIGVLDRLYEEMYVGKDQSKITERRIAKENR